MPANTQNSGQQRNFRFYLTEKYELANLHSKSIFYLKTKKIRYIYQLDLHLFFFVGELWGEKNQENHYKTQPTHKTTEIAGFVLFD